MKKYSLNTNDCISLKSQINLLTNFPFVNTNVLLNIYKEKYSKQNCDKIIQDSAYKELDKVTEKYQNIDKERIETESFTQRNYRLILGAVVLVSGLLIIVTINKK
jgi:hypothetical protein